MAKGRGRKRSFEEYRDLIPSVDERHYLKQIGYTISDYKMAAWIYHSFTLTWEEKRKLLRKMGEETSDKKLHKQIIAYFQSEKRRIERFQKFVSGYVYCLVVKEGNKRAQESCESGFYKNYEAAYQAGKESGFPYMIQKIPILAGKTEMEDMPEEYCVEYEAGGECGYIMCVDTVPREEDFTEKEFYIPCPFKTGDIVYDVIGNEYGIVQWTIPSKKVGSTGYINSAYLRVATYEKGEWTGHIHCYPWELEYARLPEKSLDSEILKHMAAIMKTGVGDLNYLTFQMAKAKLISKLEEEKRNG